MKKYRKERHEWVLTYKEIGLKPRKSKALIKTRFASKVALFKKTLEYVIAINLCFNQQIFKLQVDKTLVTSIVLLEALN